MSLPPLVGVSIFSVMLLNPRFLRSGSVFDNSCNLYKETLSCTIKVMGQVVYKLRRKKRIPKQKSSTVAIFNHVMYAVALIAPLMTLPQVWEVWIKQQTGGVSLLTWSAYAATSFLWVIYGFANHEKPIILSQLPLFFLEM